jgi:predicted RNase H-like HicB family nuclease
MVSWPSRQAYAVGETRRKVLKLVREGIELHIEALREAGEPVPPPTSKNEVRR